MGKYCRVFLDGLQALMITMHAFLEDFQRGYILSLVLGYGLRLNTLKQILIFLDVDLMDMCDQKLFLYINVQHKFCQFAGRASYPFQ